MYISITTVENKMKVFPNTVSNWSWAVMWMLEIGPRSCGRTVSALSHQTISPALRQNLLMNCLTGVGGVGGGGSQSQLDARDSAVSPLQREEGKKRSHPEGFNVSSGPPGTTFTKPARSSGAIFLASVLIQGFCFVLL